MKKRIGSRLYNTDTAECIAESIGLYRQRNRQTYFIYDGQEIKPIEYNEAEKLLLEIGIKDTTTHKAGKNGQTKIGVSPAAADRLAAYCRINNITQKAVIESFINSLPLE